MLAKVIVKTQLGETAVYTLWEPDPEMANHLDLSLIGRAWHGKVGTRLPKTMLVEVVARVTKEQRVELLSSIIRECPEIKNRVLDVQNTEVRVKLKLPRSVTVHRFSSLYPDPSLDV